MFTIPSTACFNNAFKNPGMHPTAKRLIDAIHAITKGKVDGEKSPGDVAQALGQSSATITNWKTRGVSKEGRLKAHTVYGISPTWVDTGAGAMFDGLHGLDGNTSPGPDVLGKIPLISWVRAGELCESHDNYHTGDAEAWFDCPVAHGPHTYCLQLDGDSMDDGSADAYRDGEIIFVDPDASPVPGSDVVVRTPENKTTFKRLKQDSEGPYLLGLNGKKIVRVPEGTVYCGVVIFSGRKR